MYADARKKDIPILQLNPGGTLNHKYAGETAVRGSGLPYSVIRSTGVHSSPALLLFQQGLQDRHCATEPYIVSMIMYDAFFCAPCECLLIPPLFEVATAILKQETNPDYDVTVKKDT